MHAGEVVEESGVESFFASPHNPASLSLLAAQLGHQDDSLRLAGFPIHPSALPPGCWLHPRCPFATAEAGCSTEHPPLLEVAPNHRARCHRTGYVAPVAEQHLRELAAEASPLRRKRLAAPARNDANRVLEVRGVGRRFSIVERQGVVGRRARHVLQACSDINFDAYRGETIGIIGESGSGKTTLARVICGLLPASTGEIVLDGKMLTNLTNEEQRRLRAELQIVFQEPAESMNPMMTVGQQIAEPLHQLRGLSRRKRRETAKTLLRMVGLSDQLADRIPGTLSGGQLQRASIARAISTNPAVVVLDEPTAQLSPEAEEHVLELLNELQAEMGLTYIYISHDLSLVRSICDRVLIMYLGQIVEIGTTREIFECPQHPYTRTLVSSILRPDPRQRAERVVAERLDGEIPSPIDLPTGCYLAARCHHAVERCRAEAQALEPDQTGRLVRCWRARAGEFDAEPVAATAAN
jgi:oligopeptide/dipeptide ABC transporter ATP-binding protein